MLIFIICVVLINKNKYKIIINGKICFKQVKNYKLYYKLSEMTEKILINKYLKIDYFYMKTYI